MLVTHLYIAMYRTDRYSVDLLFLSRSYDLLICYAKTKQGQVGSMLYLIVQTRATYHLTNPFADLI